LRHNVGDGLAHLKAHAAWDRKPPSPANIPAALAILFYDYPVQDRWHSFWMGATSLLLFLGLGLRALRVRGVFAASMILLPILQALLTGTPMSLERIVLASSLAFLDLAEILKRPWLFWSCLAGFSTMQLWLLNGYVHFQFMG